jgi:1-acyl-sn-glycerol-3-phosphate acyltransferase
MACTLCMEMESESGDEREWSYATARDLEEPLLKRLERFPREPDMFVYTLRTIANLLLRAWMRMYHRTRITGRDHIPDTSCVIVANHQSHLDTAAILSALPLNRLHRAFPCAAKEYFFESVPRLAVATVLVNALPFARQAKGSSTLRMCRALLQNPGNILILFPEGTRATDADMGKFLPGIGHIVAGSNVLVVPCRLTGTREALPKSASVPRPRKITVTFGPPMTFEHHRGGRGQAQAVAETLRETIRTL